MVLVLLLLSTVQKMVSHHTSIKHNVSYTLAKCCNGYRKYTAVVATIKPLQFAQLLYLAADILDELKGG